jgi:hypothetical protein
MLVVYSPKCQSWWCVMTYVDGLDATTVPCFRCSLCGGFRQGDCESNAAGVSNGYTSTRRVIPRHTTTVRDSRQSGGRCRKHNQNRRLPSCRASPGAGTVVAVWHRKHTASKGHVIALCTDHTPPGCHGVEATKAISAGSPRRCHADMRYRRLVSAPAIRVVNNDHGPER